MTANELERLDGKLTIKSLAAEAGVKRWILTHKHQQDLQSEFHAHVQCHGRGPDPGRLLKRKVERLTEENKRLRAELREVKASCSILERLIAVQALEEQTTSRPARHWTVPCSDRCRSCSCSDPSSNHPSHSHR